MPEKETKNVSMQDNIRASLRIEVNTNLTKCYKIPDYIFLDNIQPQRLSAQKTLT